MPWTQALKYLIYLNGCQTYGSCVPSTAAGERCSPFPLVHIFPQLFRTRVPLLSSQLVLWTHLSLYRTEVMWNYAQCFPVPKASAIKYHWRKESSLYCLSDPLYTPVWLQHVGLFWTRLWASHQYNLYKKWQPTVAYNLLLPVWSHAGFTLEWLCFLSATPHVSIIRVYKASMIILHLKAHLGTC